MIQQRVQVSFTIIPSDVSQFSTQRSPLEFPCTYEIHKMLSFSEDCLKERPMGRVGEDLFMKDFHRIAHETAVSFPGIVATFMAEPRLQV